MLHRVEQEELWEWVAYFKIKNGADSANGPGDPVEAAIAAQRATEIEEEY